jgi:hypothetical protein
LCGFKQISFVTASTDDLDTPVAYDNSLEDFRGDVLDLISFQYDLMFLFCVRCPSSLTWNLYEVCLPVDVLLVLKELENREICFKKILTW